MAKIKDLKKDINYLTSEVLTQGFITKELNEKVNEDELYKIMAEAIEARNEFVARANHPDGKDNPKLVKAYYQKLRKNMMEKTLELFSKYKDI